MKKVTFSLKEDKKNLKRELARVNIKIDRLIQQGKTYAKEANLHKRIVLELGLVESKL